MNVCCPGWIGTIDISLHDYIEMHGQQNVKKNITILILFKNILLTTSYLLRPADGPLGPKNYAYFQQGIFTQRKWLCLRVVFLINRLTPNDPYIGRTASLTSKRFILYIYSTNIGTEYFKHALYFPFFSLQNAVSFIMLTCLVPVLFTFYIQNVLKLKKIIPAPKG